MLWIHLLQEWFTLSDPLMEEMPSNTPYFRRFAEIEAMEARMPVPTTIVYLRAIRLSDLGQ